jgi:5'-nucleotidase
MRKRIAIDMDETIVDTLSRHLEWYNREFNQQLTKADLQGMKIYQRVPEEHRAQVRAYPDDSRFFADLEPFDDAINVIRALSEDYEIVIATAAMEHPTSFSAKYEWLARHLPFLSPMNFIFCGRKYLVNADYLIDDSSRHFVGFCGTGILFTAPHNVHEAAAVRVNNWLQVQELFRINSGDEKSVRNEAENNRRSPETAPLDGSAR